MNGLWKKRVPALLLTLVMIISLSPMALADDPPAANTGTPTTTTGDGKTGDTTTGAGDPTGGGTSGGDNTGGGDKPETPSVHDHSWDSGTVTKKPTCVNEGVRTYTCTVPGCMATKTEPISATGGHKWDFVSTTATCGSAGILTERCSKCGLENTSDAPATGEHQWKNNGSPTQEATCGQDGIQPQICSVCGQAQDTKIPATKNHDWEKKVITQPTCTAQGSQQNTCKVCGKIETAVAIPALGHTKPDANGKCTRCGEVVQAHVHQKKGGIQSDATHHWYNCAGCSERLEEAVHGSANAEGKCPTCGYVLHTHSWAKGWTTNTTSHWHACTGASCTAKNQEGTHTFVNNVCSVCGYVNSANTFTVRFYNGSTVINTQNVAQNGYPTVPGNPSRTGCTFRGWLAYNPNGALYTTGTVTVDPSKVGITRATDYYAVFSVNATGQNATIAAATNIGSTLWTQIRTKCSALGLSPIFVRFSLGDSRYGSLYTSSTQSSAYAVSASTDYTSNQISSMTFKAGSSSGTYALGYTAFDNSSSNKVSGTIYITSDSAAGVIPYSVSAGKSVSFSRRDFQNLCRDRVGGTLNYVTFSRPGSEYDDYGAVYNSSSSLTRSDLGGSYAYYDKADAGRNDYYLDNLSFRADSKAKSGTLTLSFTGYNTNRDRFDGSVEITVKGGTSKGDVTYNVDPGKEVDFDSRDFNRAFQDKYGSTRTDLTYVSFTAPSGYTSFRGAVRVGSSSLDRSELNTYNFYYNSKDATGRNDYALDRMSFKADSNAKDGDSITIPFRAYYGTGSRYEECSLVINIGKGTSRGDIEYEVAPGKSVDFRARDFSDFFRDEYSGYTLSYVEFDQPSSSAFSQGTLYHNYGSSSSKSFTRTTLDDDPFYYDPTSKQYGVGDLTFVAASGFKDTVTLEFTAYGTSGNRSVKGTVTIRSTESDDDGDLNYKVAPGGSVALKRTDFNTFFREEYRDTVYYVVFSRPSDTNVFSNGTLYADYGTSSQTSFTRNNISGARFYYDKKNMGKSDYYLDALTFVAGSGFKDSISLDFTAYGEDDDEYVEGTLVIKADGVAASSNYAGNIRYTTTAGANLQINANDIARYYKRSYPAYTLQYVTLGGVPAAGALYYNYYNASAYGTTSRTQLTSANCGLQTFYLSPTSTSQYALTELTYVPSGSNYCASIPFTAYGTGGISLSGTILISVSRAAVAEVYGVTPKNTAVSFPAAQIYNAVYSATGSALSGIQLLSLPALTAGTLYLGTGSTTWANTSTVYTYAAGANQMSQLRFVPNASFTGSVEIPYVALTANGTALATGTFSLGVLNSRKTLKDVNSSTWCYKYVMELTDQNVISGYNDGSFKPNSTVTYGAALKLIMLAAGYPEQAPTGKNVFSGYLSRAQADGIITRSNVNLTAPITRLQVAQLAAGALKLSTSGLSSVKPFTDTADPHVQALNAAGIVEGYFSNGTSTYRPSNTLNRGQMSAIVWRMNQYRK